MLHHQVLRESGKGGGVPEFRKLGDGVSLFSLESISPSQFPYTCGDLIRFNLNTFRSGADSKLKI